MAAGARAWAAAPGGALLIHCRCVDVPTGGKDWASRVPHDRVISSHSLEMEGVERSLVSVVPSGSGSSASGGAALGSGTFGNVGTYRYHGALVAVKEVKAGADEDSIGKG